MTHGASRAQGDRTTRGMGATELTEPSQVIEASTVTEATKAVEATKVKGVADDGEIVEAGGGLV